MLAAVSMMRDEADILALSIGALREGGVDLIIVADNLSTDGTGDLLRDMGVEVHEDREPGYWQADKMTALAKLAWARKASWVIPFDADEVWRTDGHRLDALLPPFDCDVILAHPHVMVPTESGGWRRRHEAERFPKVSFRPNPDAKLGMGNHEVHWPGGVVRENCGIEIDHYQYRSLEQVRRKARNGAEAYDATTLDPTYGAHWRNLAAMTDDELEAWWVRYLAG